MSVNTLPTMNKIPDGGDEEAGGLVKRNVNEIEIMSFAVESKSNFKETGGLGPYREQHNQDGEIRPQPQLASIDSNHGFI